MSELTFTAFRQANAARRKEWVNGNTDEWNLGDWGNAMGGEVGEMIEALLAALSAVAHSGQAQNIIKKMRRLETHPDYGTRAEDAWTMEMYQEQLGDELADVLTYLDIIAMLEGIDLGEAARRKFNKISDREGLQTKLP